MDDKKLNELGEKVVVEQIIKSLEVPDNLIFGFGHDSAFVDTEVGSDEVLLVNTDRSGVNVAYTLGISDAECIGDFGVSHSVSDIFASGGKPIAISIALLLPGDLTLRFVKEVMRGAEKAAKKYGAILASGDTKKNSKFAMVVTAIGKAKKDEILTRSSARSNDLLVVTGYLGTMFAGLLAKKQNICISERAQKLFTNALINQNPPHVLSSRLAKAKIPSSCTDISDGIASSLHSLSSASGLGAYIYESKLPIHPEGVKIANSIKIRAMNLTLTGGDWQYLYTVPKENIDRAFEISSSLGFLITVVGEMTEGHDVIIETLEGNCKLLKRIEKDKFKDEDFMGKITKPNFFAFDNCCNK